MMSDPNCPRFEGAVGQLARSRAFIEFICRNVSRTVRLDVSMPEDEFSGVYKHAPLWLALYYDVSWQPDPCGSTASGVEITLSRCTEGTDATFDCVDGQVRLRGSFVVLGLQASSPGFITVALEPLITG